MSNNYSLDSLIRSIYTESHTKQNQIQGISKDEFMKQYKGTAKEALMEKIYSVFDFYDAKKDGTANVASKTWGNNMEDHFFNYDPKTKEFFLNEKQFKKILGENITVDNFKEALETLKKLADEKLNALIKTEQENKIQELEANNENIPKHILEKIVNFGNISIKAVNDGYEAVSQDGGEETIYQFDFEGNLVKRIDNYTNTLQGEFGDYATVVNIFDKNGDSKEWTEKYKEGYTYTHIPADDKGVLIYGKTQVSYLHMDPRKITINTGLPNETTFAVSTDDQGNITDISNADNNQILKMSDKTKKLLITLLNKEAVLGRDFDLNVNCNEVSVEIIKDENIPDKAKSEIDKLGYAGMLEEEDYKTEQLENGDFAIEYLTNASKDFASDKKKAVFGADGSETIYEIKGDKVYITGNGNVQEYSKEEFSAIKPEYNEWVNGYDSESQENYARFKIEDSDFADKLYKTGEKEYLSDSAYTQQIGESAYKVTIQDNKISVTKDGKEFFIYTSGITKGEAKFIAESNPEALFRIAEKDIKLILQNPPTGGDGEYLPEENVIYIAPEASSVSILQRRIAHETGHSYYTHLNDVNKELEESFKKESEQYEREIEAIKASVTPEVSSLDTDAKQIEALRKFDKYAPEDSDARYCAENVYEFVAEAYCLLVTGDAKSEFTIAKVYPETFELVKKMIEESH